MSIKTAKSNMYEEYKTWNVFKGCEFDCSYCKRSFQRQAKRQKHLCKECYYYKPHFHVDRLTKLPSSSKIFACGNGDIAFCSNMHLQAIMQVISAKQDKTFLLQSKAPVTFNRIKEYPSNLILGTTIETDRLDIYKGITKAPHPEERVAALSAIKHSRKMLTLEPILKFNHHVMLDWIKQVNPELIWLGYDSKKTPGLIEPSLYAANELYKALLSQGYTVKLKYIPYGAFN